MMCMSKIEYKYPVDVLVSKIFKIYHIFGESSTVSSKESTPLVLLLLSMFKDGLINAQSLNNYDSFEKFQETIDRLSHGHDKNHQYQDIVQILKESLAKINNHAYNLICHTLWELDSKYLKENFAKVFDDVLYRVSQSQGRYAGEFLQPVELTRFICALADLPPNARVYNPFAGLASFGVYLDHVKDYFGQELNPTTWALGVLRLMAYDKISISRYSMDDSILKWPVTSEKFDLIVAHPPLILDLLHLEIKGKFINVYSKVEQFLTEKSLENLTDTGKIIAVLPSSFSQRRDGSEHIIADLVGKDLIDTIISIPGGLLMNTGIPLEIMVLNKSKRIPGKVRFVNAKKFVLTNKNRGNILDDASLINSIFNEIHDDEVIRIIDNEQIIANDYNLNVLRYFRKQIEGVKLGDILEQVRGQRANLPEKGRLIRIRDLKDDKIDFILDLSTVEETELRRTDIHLLAESGLLLAIRWRDLKPTLFEFKGEPIFKSQDILSFKINDNIVDKAYLINELHANYVLEQLESIRTGVAIPFIRKEDLMKVVIKLPSLEEQRAKVEGTKQAFIQAKEDELRLQKEILGIKEDTFKEFASIKHTFRQYLSALKSNVAGTRKYLNKKKGQPISLDDVYSVKLNQTLAGHLSSIEETIDALGKLLESDSFTTNSSDIANFNISELVNIAHQRFYQDLFKFEIEIDEESFYSEEQTLAPVIEINKEDFFKMFSNIVTNAMQHGFKNSEGNIMRSNISYDAMHEQCVLKVSNNGIPMPDKFTLKHLTTRGEKTTDSKGTGIGGADIRDIVSKYKGTFELINDASSLFPVTYKISFPIIKTMKEDEI